ncbi:hypothetical protein EIP91_005854 [Steccherinum ochraceum]|uniref:DUF6533 domain-containing protein n=1 Tax=Steccherinum ochraceum TaxID=92696 RepID=A0A4V2MVN1_9APHY|nr:hypothetical protein EIP91_005854 [Steccherinum ochraceum]
MNSTTTSLPDPYSLPNPFTQLAWLPPDIANQVRNVEFMLAALAGFVVWDVFWSLPEEYKMLSKRRIGPFDVVYVLSRIMMVFFVSTLSIFGRKAVSYSFYFQPLLRKKFLPTVVKYEDCSRQGMVQGWAAGLSTPLTSLLFLIRIRAVFYRNPFIVAFFGVFWLAILGTSLIVPFSPGLKVVPIGDSGYCVNDRLSTLAILGVILAGAFDTLVFLAITVSLLRSHAFNGGPRAWMKMFFTGQGMGSLTRVMLQSGQTYYLATVGFTVTIIALISSPHVSYIYSDSLVPVTAFVSNTMAARVYRKLKLELLKDTVDLGPMVLTTDPLGSSADAMEFQVRTYRNASAISESTAGAPISHEERLGDAVGKYEESSC